MKALDHVLGDA